MALWWPVFCPIVFVHVLNPGTVPLTALLSVGDRRAGGPCHGIEDSQRRELSGIAFEDWEGVCWFALLFRGSIFDHYLWTAELWGNWGAD